MKKVQWVFLLFAIATAACILGIGIAVALRNVTGVIICALLVVLMMGLAFMRKKKMRENGTL